MLNGAGHGQVLDREEFLERLGGDYELAADVVQLFVDDCPRRVTAVREAIERQDPAQLQAEAHALKGAAGNLSAKGLADLARTLEHLAGEGNLDTALALWPQLFEEMSAVLDAVRSLDLQPAAH